MFGKPIPEIDVKMLAEKLKSDEEFVLLDVRESWELARAKIDDKRLVHAPLSFLSAKGTSMLSEAAQSDALSGSKGPESRVYVICHHGARSSDVTRWLVAQGWKNAVSVRGGIEEYARKVDPKVGFY